MNCFILLRVVAICYRTELTIQAQNKNIHTLRMIKNGVLALGVGAVVHSHVTKKFGRQWLELEVC